MAVKLLDMLVVPIEEGAVGRYFESKAFGLRSSIILTAASLTVALSGLFSHDTHLQDELQVALAAKHWQYLYNVNVEQLR